jgi:hypothetical protein
MITKTNNRTRLSMSGTTYDFDFRIDAESELEVYGIDSDGVATELTTGFTVSFSAIDEEGTVTFDAEPTGYTEILMLRAKPYTQTTDIPIRGGFSEEDIEGALDSIVIQIQQLKELIDSAVKQDPTAVAVDVVLPAPEDGKVLTWDGTSGAMKNSVESLADIEAAVGDLDQAVADAQAAQTAAEIAQTAAEAAAGSMTLASQVEAEAATDNTKYMSALRVKQLAAVVANLPVKDEDNMASNSASHVPTQQSTKAYADSLSTKFKIGAFTRVMDTATGDVAYTGVGFTPKAIVALGKCDPDSIATICASISQGLDSYLVATYTATGVKATQGAYFLSFVEGVSLSQVAVLKSLDADGFTLTWTRTGSTSGNTAYGYYLAIG